MNRHHTNLFLVIVYLFKNKLERKIHKRFMNSSVLHISISTNHYNIRSTGINENVFEMKKKKKFGVQTHKRRSVFTVG